MARKNNIIFFIMDQVSAKWFEAALNGACEVPNFQRLVSQGTYFNNCYTSNPVCCPARATIATGLTSRGHGVLQNGYFLDPSIPTFMHGLQKSNYETGAFGKLHLRPQHESLYHDYRSYGFDVCHNTEDNRGGEWLDWVEETWPEHYESVLATVWGQMDEFKNYGSKKMDLQSKIYDIRTDFKWGTAKYPDCSPGCYIFPFPDKVSQSNWITSHGIEFIESAVPDTPFFAYMSYVLPHPPFSAPEDCMDKVDTSKIPRPIPNEWINDKEHSPFCFFRRNLNLTEDSKTIHFERHMYFASLVHLDRQLGTIFEALEQTKSLNNTHIILAADHGEMLHDHGFGGKQEHHYDACIRVPLIVSGPGFAADSSREEFVQLEDICPTILDMTSSALPALPGKDKFSDGNSEFDPSFQLPGKSLVPLCKNQDLVDWRSEVYVESYNTIQSNDRREWARTIRTGEYRYTYYPDGGGGQLFNIKTDPDETNNLYHDPLFREIMIELKDRLFDLTILQDYPKTRRSLFKLGTF